MTKFSPADCLEQLINNVVIACIQYELRGFGASEGFQKGWHCSSPLQHEYACDKCSVQDCKLKTMRWNEGWGPGTELPWHSESAVLPYSDACTPQLYGLFL